MLASKTRIEEQDRYPFPTATDLMTLCRTEGPCVSIFLGPHRAGSGSRPSGTTLSAMLPRIEAALESCGMHAQDAAKMTEPLKTMAGEPRLLASHRDSICLFRSPRTLHCFSIRPTAEAEFRVEERFVLGPVLAHLDYRQSFLLLALAGKHIRLLRCEGGDVEAVPIPDGVPESIADFIYADERGPEQGKNHAFGVQFGSETAKEKRGHFRRGFMTAIDRGLQPVYRAHGLPLVLAGVEEEAAAYTAVSEYAELLPEPVRMSPDGGATDTELAEAGAQIAKRWSSAAEKQALAEYNNAGPARRRADGKTILQAAAAGMIQHLFVARGGRMEGDARRLTGLGAAEGYVYRNDDLVNAAAVETLLHKGTVWLIEPEQMPEAGVLAAVLRYAGAKTGQ